MDSTNNELTNGKTRLKVSSTLKGSEYVKQNIFDGNNDTAWHSDQGKFQFVYIFFEEAVDVNEVDITFCGGFCPKV